MSWPRLNAVTRIERFWTMVTKGPGCWIHRGFLLGRYAGFWNGKTNVGAHRFLFEHLNGPIPEGMEVCHRCDVPRCVNPDHLFLGTHDDNMKDAKAKGRFPLKAHCKRGHVLNEVGRARSGGCLRCQYDQSNARRRSPGFRARERNRKARRRQEVKSGSV